MSPIKLAGLILGCVIGFVGFIIATLITAENTRLAKNASETPEVVRLADLAARDREANRHLRLVEYGFGHDYIYHGSSDKWDRVWVPLIAPQSDTSKPIVQGVVLCRRVANTSDYIALKREKSFQGMNVSGVTLIPTEIQKQLAGFYPGVDFSAIPLFDEGTTPPSETSLIVSQCIMIGLLALGFASTIAWITIAKWHSQGARAMAV